MTDAPQTAAPEVPDPTSAAQARSRVEAIFAAAAAKKTGAEGKRVHLPKSLPVTVASLSPLKGPRPKPPKRRPADWAESMAKFVEQRRDMPFAWGTHDCFLFAADAVNALHGIDFMAPFRGKYSTEQEAEALLAAHGGLEQAAAGRMQAVGLPETAPNFAHRHDVALVQNGNQLLLGLVLGVHVAVTGSDGLRFVRRSMIRRAWAV